MGRDRDPFDRTLEALRARLAMAGPLQGRALAINALAGELGVSPTPVREVLAGLAGEGLIVRTAAGYAGVEFDPDGLVELYALAKLLALAAMRRPSRAPLPPLAPGGRDLLQALVAAGGGRALTSAYLRVRGQLAPFAQAEAKVVADDLAEGRRLAEALARGQVAVMRAAARYYDRRIARGARILAAGLVREN